MVADTGPRWELPADVAATATEYPFFAEIAAEVARYLADDSSGHSLDHAWRVFVLGVRLARAEGGDERIVGAAALTHDIHRVLDGGVHPTESLDVVTDILAESGFPSADYGAVRHCVAVHDEYAFRGIDHPVDSREAKILRDADNLEAMGAVGVARCFAFGALAGNPLWAPDGGSSSSLGHFEDKLFRLREEMHTETAREMAAGRHEFLETFADRFRQEWYGKQ